MATSTLRKAISTLLGLAFGAQALDDEKEWWARLAYGLVGFDILRRGWSDGDVFDTSGQRLADAGPMAKSVLSQKATTPLKFDAQRVGSLDERVARIHEQMIAGTADPKVYSLARAVLSRKCGGTWCVPEKDALAEIRAVFGEVRTRVRYTWDPTDYDAFQTPGKTLELANGDCVPADSLVVASGYNLKPIGEVQVGEHVLGDGQWTKVTNTWNKGKKRVLAFELSNGCTLRCTSDHKVFKVPRVKSTRKGGSAGSRDSAVEVRAGALNIGDDLLTALKQPAGREHLDEDRAWLLGTHIADGWSEDYRVSISGKDGHPKEAQKKRVQSICEKLGLATRWHERYITINDPDTARWLGACGHTAINKHVPSLDLNESTIRAVLEGLKADSGVATSGTRVFSTISEKLALQLRLMYRMLGQSCHIRRVVEHGGLGTNPIYRVTVRTERGNQLKPHARIVGIRDLGLQPVVDIETDTHRFYLPESDTVVHNCDDMVSLLGAMLRSIGYKVRSRVVWTKGFSTWNHIYLLVQLPATSEWMALDATVDKAAGWEVPESLMLHPPRDFDVKE